MEKNTEKYRKKIPGPGRIKRSGGEPLYRILAIDTSGRTLSVALAESGEKFRLKKEIRIDAGLRHSEILKETCEKILEKCSWEKEDLTHLAVTTGPGSFTGLRVSISFLRALSQGLMIPLTGVPVFEVIAKGLQNFAQYRLCVLIDSIGGEVFAGFFKPGGTRPETPYGKFDLAGLFKKTGARSKTVFAGEGFLKHEKEIRQALGRLVISAPPDKHYPRAKYAAEIAAERIKTLKPDDQSWRKVVPYYLREPVAVERLNYGKKKSRIQ